MGRLPLTLLGTLLVGAALALPGTAAHSGWNLSGTWKNSFSGDTITVTQSGDTITAVVPPRPNTTLRVDITATIAGNRLSGTYKTIYPPTGAEGGYGKMHAVIESDCRLFAYLDESVGPTPSLYGRWTKQPCASARAKFGIGFVPFMNAGDSVEQAMHMLVGSFRQIKVMYNPATPAQLFQILINQKRLSRQVDTIVIAGHGSKANPRIDLSRVDLEPKDVDLQFLRKQADVLGRANARGKLSPELKQRLAAVRTQLALLASVSESQAKGAQVLLVNCSAAATPEGVRFVRNLGEVLLGKRGGVIVASRTDVELGQVRSLANKIRALLKTGEDVDIGEFFVTGDWRRFPIPARG